MFLLPWAPKRGTLWFMALSQRGAIQGGAAEVWVGQLPQTTPRGSATVYNNGTSKRGLDQLGAAIAQW